jgi:putative transposase
MQPPRLGDPPAVARFCHPLLHLIARATHDELARQVHYLKVENEILRSRLPRRITVTPAERMRLLRLGTLVGPAIRELITIVSLRTFAAWMSGDLRPQRERPARHRKPTEIRQLVCASLERPGVGQQAISDSLRELLGP